jgi:hypothetical protein
MLRTFINKKVRTFKKLASHVFRRCAPPTFVLRTQINSSNLTDVCLGAQRGSKGCAANKAAGSFSGEPSEPN